MVVLDQFYQIVEQDTSKVSPMWKVLHVGSCILSAICGFLTAITFGRILDEFDYNCVLHAEIIFDNSTFLNDSRYSRLVRAIDTTASNWGTQSYCNFAQFTPLVSMISALVWAVYFGMTSRGGAGSPTDYFSRPWSILYPFLIFNAIFFIVYVISMLRLKEGLKEFCMQFQSEFNNTGCVPQIQIYTAQFQEVTKDSHFYNFYPNMLVAVISSEIGVWSWVFQLLVCVIRMCFVADFDFQLITILKKEEEELEHVVELLDDDEEEVSNI